MEHNRVIYTRPYDAEVEYLETDGYSFIDTGILTSSVLDIESKAQMVNANSPKVLFGGETNYNLHNFVLYLSEKTTHEFIFKWNGTERGSSGINTSPHIFRTVTTDTRKNVYMDTYLKIRNAERGNDFISTRTMTLFKRNQIGNGIKSTAGLRIYYFKIYDNGVLVRDFIPVRVGSVGYMYDRVSGKLFGNAGTGDFVLGNDVAVPNLRRVFRFDNKRFVVPSGLEEGVDYQRYDWLKGDGTAYIDTLIHDLSNVQILSIKSKLPTEQQTLFGRERKKAVNSTQLLIYSNTNRYSVWTFNSPATLSCRKEDTATFDFDNNIIKSSTNQISKTLGKVDGWNLYLFGRCINNRLYAEAGKITIGNFKIDSIINLTPCQLLRSIPASFDANGIARQIGECGMVDLLSGKFYGNVASSGSFTVENDND